MADDHIGRAGIRQHFGREVAGIGARFLGVAILAADGDAGADGALRRRRPIRVAGGQTSELHLGLQAGRVAGVDLSSTSAERFKPFIFQFPATSGRGLSTLIDALLSRLISWH